MHLYATFLSLLIYISDDNFDAAIALAPLVGFIVTNWIVFAKTTNHDPRLFYSGSNQRIGNRLCPGLR
jgi:hypothetical protein